MSAEFTLQPVDEQEFPGSTTNISPVAVTYDGVSTKCDLRLYDSGGNQVTLDIQDYATEAENNRTVIKYKIIWIPADVPPGIYQYTFSLDGDAAATSNNFQITEFGG